MGECCRAESVTGLVELLGKLRSEAVELREATMIGSEAQERIRHWEKSDKAHKMYTCTSS